MADESAIQVVTSDSTSPPKVRAYKWGRQEGIGRSKGTANKATAEIKNAARAIVNDPEYRALLMIRLKLGEAPHMETLLWHYAYGKPKEQVEVKHVEDFGGLSADELRERSMAVAETLIHLHPPADEPDESAATH